MKVAIVGGGLGGLSAAVTLAKAGVEVKLFEKNDHFGGKMMPVNEAGYHFDFGPNTITMPDVFQDVLRQGGLEKELSFTKLTHHTRNQFKDGTTFDLSSDRQYMKQQLYHLDKKGFENYDAFLLEIERLFHLSKQYFLHRTFSGWKDYLSPSLAKGFAQVRPLESMDHFFRRYFSHPSIIQSLNRYSTYVGSNPYVTPATFAMIAHLELNDGVYYVPGGNTKIAENMAKAAENQGAQLYKNTRAEKILTHNKQVTGVVAGGHTYEADYVIVNGDLLQSVPELIDNEKRNSLSNKKLRSFDPSISAFVIMAGLDTSVPDLHHHHVLFSRNYEEEFSSLKNGHYAEEPTIYIGTSAKSDSTISSEGDNCFILVNAPALGTSTEIDRKKYKEKIYEELAYSGLPIKNHVSFEKVIGPEEIESRFGAYRGSLYGPSSNRRLQAFMRPFNQSQDFSNLYFCGGSTHPGGGSPMVVLSGQNVANQILGKIVHTE